MDEVSRPPEGPGGERPPEESEPELEGGASGTLFIMVVFLMAMAGLWGIMFLKLLEL